MHQANNFIVTDGLPRGGRGVAAEFPDVALGELIVEATAAWLVREPSGVSNGSDNVENRPPGAVRLG